jgi:hypothetical protein
MDFLDASSPSSRRVNPFVIEEKDKKDSVMEGEFEKVQRISYTLSSLFVKPLRPL